MALQIGHKVVTPREDLHEERTLDVAEFAVHPDQHRDNPGPDVYRMPGK